LLTFLQAAFEQNNWRWRLRESGVNTRLQDKHLRALLLRFTGFIKHNFFILIQMQQRNLIEQIIGLPGGVRLEVADGKQAALAAMVVRELSKPC
jgi:hypothetical protein